MPVMIFGTSDANFSGNIFDFPFIDRIDFSLANNMPRPVWTALILIVIIWPRFHGLTKLIPAMQYTYGE